jgi:hypothetical protein
MDGVGKAEEQADLKPETAKFCDAIGKELFRFGIVRTYCGLICHI